MKISRIAICIVIAFSISSFVPNKKPAVQKKDNELTAAEKKQGWKLLFDGKTLDKWRTYKNRPDEGWVALNGELYCKEQGVTNRADLITKDQFASFELQLDWKISSGANSGIMYHVLETHEATYETGPEYQLIDDVGFPSKLEDWQHTGADYAMHPPFKIASKPVGEYNHTILRVNGNHVQHWLNGVKVADFYAWTPEWQKLKEKGKWKDHPDYGNAKSGFIAFQGDHGGGVWFKNIKIKLL